MQWDDLFVKIVMFLKLFFHYTCTFQKNMSETKSQGRTRNEYLILLADLIFVQFSSYFFYYVYTTSKVCKRIKNKYLKCISDTVLPACVKAD